MIIDDPGLPALRHALQPDFMLERVAAAVGLEAAPLSASDCQIDLLKHVAGHRATIQYTVRTQTEAPIAVIGKLYRSGRRAARIERWLTTLNEDVFLRGDMVRVPFPLAVAPHLGLVFLRFIQGADLRHSLDAGAYQQPVALAARFLGRIHAAHPLDELRVRTVEHELSKAIGWLDQAIERLGARSEREDHMRARLNALLTSPPATRLTMIHRDFYYANLLWDGSRIWAVDLDQLRIGDPALDVAHFLAHLEVLAYRQTGDPAGLDAQGQAFLEAYAREAPDTGWEARLPLYRAYTFLKLASTEARRARDAWRDVTRTLVDLACREMARL